MTDDTIGKLANIKVIIESPYGARNITDDEKRAQQVNINVRYARACLHDSLERGECPFASHLLYTQVLNDNDSVERQMGMDAGLAWMEMADFIAVYTDRGVSNGMKYGIEQASLFGKRIEFRELPDWKEPPDDL